MKTNVRTEIKPRRLDRASLEFIMDVAARQSVGLEERCARYRHRVRLFRTTVAACVVVLVSATAGSAYAQPRSYSVPTIHGSIDTVLANNAVHTTLYRHEAV